MILLAKTVNSVFCQTGGDKYLATMLIAHIELDTGIIEILNAGHNHPYVVSTKDNQVKTIKAMGNRIGYSKYPVFDVKKYQMEKGDILFCYTDGLIENPCLNLGKPISAKKFKTMIEKNSKDKKTLLKAFEGLHSSVKAEDDMAYMLCEWKG